jgi:hypothetical protein
MKRRSSAALLVVSLLVWGGCVDTAEPTGPVPGPPPDDGGELRSPPAVSTDDGTGSTSAARRSFRPSN